MCKIYRVKKVIVITLLLIAGWSCNEDEFLKEVPLDFYAPNNSYVTYKDFDAAVNNLYYRFRSEFYDQTNALRSPRVMLWGTDLVLHNHGAADFPNFSELIVPTNNFVYTAVWKPSYLIIYDANVVLNRVDEEQSELTEEEKKLIKAEAYFFRAYAYKMLANLYGGVPIVLEETTEPKRDYTRASRNEVYEQCLSDLLFATENLKGISEVDDSRISNLVAYHVLAEVYVSLGRWQEAIDAATMVINDPATSLMNERFGGRVDDEVNPRYPWAFGGDVYWDLFRKGNLNRSSGNTEALWVLQYEYNVPGGGGGGVEWERFFTPRLWKATLINDDGSTVRMTPTPNTYYGGRSGGFNRLTNYFYWDLWEKSGEGDIRNSEFNVVRDFKVNNPGSDYDGKWILKDNVPINLSSFTDTLRDFYPLITKTASMGDHPQDVWLEDQTIPGSITLATGPSYVCHRNEYHLRLAETYLLRAEAYLGNNDLGNAAKDLNMVRSRSNAPDVQASEVDIDYILDERLRELYVEEFRLLTLTRLGKLVERAQKYHKYGETYGNHNNLWPIPFSEIEKNIEADLEQNPGYN